ncbi:hypothetical protein [Tenacibaculum sp. MAR_2009_124]|uniref:hypothetical protein n=1 Tax=Tenacibaculum sp. MAR_2009_124 TaxID=1250059 RepID=UPI00159FB80C|nr:hypothetical protein [Tenacibaculum sp. MAR_2009_124]
MKKLENCILNQVSIKRDTIDNILSVFEPIEITKGNFFVEAGKVCRKMGFIESGYMRYI